MFIRRRTAAIIACAIALQVLSFGCAERSHCHCEFVERARPSLLFGTEPSAPLATYIGRAPWPAVADGFHSTEDTIFVEYYRDYFGGNDYSERSNPQRQFRSYRVGASRR